MSIFFFNNSFEFVYMKSFLYLIYVCDKRVDISPQIRRSDFFISRNGRNFFRKNRKILRGQPGISTLIRWKNALDSFIGEKRASYIDLFWTTGNKKKWKNERDSHTFCHGRQLVRIPVEAFAMTSCLPFCGLESLNWFRILNADTDRSYTKNTRI